MAIARIGAALKKDKALWLQLKSQPCLLAEKQVSKAIPGDSEKVREVDDEEVLMKEYPETWRGRRHSLTCMPDGCPGPCCAMPSRSSRPPADSTT